MAPSCLPPLRSCILVLLAIGCCTAQQPFGTFNGSEYDTLSSPAKRALIGHSGFIFDLFRATRAEVSANGFQVQNNVNTNAFTHVLDGVGHSTNVLNLGNCAGNVPHSHPRGPEISIIVRGIIQFGFVEENGGHNRLVLVDAPAGSIVHIPQGLLHFSHNLQCEPATFVATFPVRDPGTIAWWPALMQVPTPILAASINIHNSQRKVEETIEGWKRRQLVSAPATGGSECLARCGLNYQRANGFGPTPRQVATHPDTAPVNPTDQLGNTQRRRLDRDIDFIGWSSIPRGAGFVDGTDGDNDYYRRSALEQQEGAGTMDDAPSAVDAEELIRAAAAAHDIEHQPLSEREARRLRRALPQDRITVIKPRV